MLRLPFHRFPLIRTTSLDEAGELFRRHTTSARLHLVERGARFGWRVNAVSIGPITLSANHWGASIHGESDAVEDVFTTAFPLADVPSEGVDGRTRIPVYKDRTTWLVSPSRSGAFRVGAGYRSLQLTVRGANMQTALTTLSGRPSTTPLRFEPRLSLAAGAGASLQRLVRFAVQETEHEDNAFASAIVAERFAESIIFGLLLGHPHSHTDRLARAARAAEPLHVRRAAEYLEAHAADPVRMAELAVVTGVSLRGLQIGFRKHRDCTPAEFLRERRLLLARTRLSAAVASSVSQIAFDCGFAHMGRFSAQYRARFGETPSRTRARSTLGRPTSAPSEDRRGVAK